MKALITLLLFLLFVVCPILIVAVLHDGNKLARRWNSIDARNCPLCEREEECGHFREVS